MPEPADEAVAVFVYADYVCPFSYVAAARIELLGSEVSLHDYWRPFSIHRAVPADGLPVSELGYPPDEWDAMERRVAEMAGELGIPFEMPDFVANSHDALQAAEFAKDLGRDAFRRLHRALYLAYFSEGRNLGQRDVLLDVAESVEIDTEGLERALEDGRYEEEIRAADEEAASYGIEGTPTFLFGRHKLVGAAPLEVMREAYRRAVEDESGVTPGEG